MNMKKVCSKCGIKKDLSEFYKGHNQCKSCCIKNAGEYQKKHKRQYRKYMNEYRKENKKRIKAYRKEYGKKYYSKNREIILAKRKENKESLRIADKKYYKKNREAIIAKKRKYQKENEAKYKKYGKEQAENLSTYYIAAKMKMPINDLRKYPELIEAKRMQIKIHRELRNH